MDWSQLYPIYFKKPISSEESSSENSKQVEFADIGCGYGGLLGKYETSAGYLFDCFLYP